MAYFFLTATLLLALTSLLPSASGQSPPGIEYRLGDVEFWPNPPEQLLRLVIHVTNRSEQTYWFEESPSHPGQIAEYSIMESHDGVRWTIIQSHDAATGKLVPFPPGSQTHLQIDDFSSHQRWRTVAWYQRFGILLSKDPNSRPVQFWSPTFEDLLSKVIERLGIAPFPRFDIQEVLHVSPTAMDTLLLDFAGRLVDQTKNLTPRKGPTRKFSDGIRYVEARLREFEIGTKEQLKQVLTEEDATLRDIVSLKINGRDLAGADELGQIKALVKRLPWLDTFIVGDNAASAYLALTADMPNLQRLYIWGSSSDLVQPLPLEIEQQLSLTHVRSVSVSMSEIHAGLFRALAKLPKLERLSVGEVDEDAIVLKGLTIDDLRRLLDDRSMLKLIVHFDSRGWSATDLAEVNRISEMIASRGRIVDSITAELNRKPPVPLDESALQILDTMSDEDYARDIAKRTEVAFQLFSRPDVFRHYPNSSTFAVRRAGKLEGVLGFSLRITELSEEDVPFVSEAIGHFPEIGRLDITFKQRTSEFPLRLLQAAKGLPNLRTLSLQTDCNWTQEAFEVVSEISQLRSLEGLAISDKPESKRQALQSLKRLSRLNTLGLTATSHDCWETVAALPQLTQAQVSVVRIEPISEQTRLAIAGMNGRELALSIEGACHPSLVRALWSIKSMKSLWLDVHTEGASIDDFRGIESLQQLEYLHLTERGSTQTEQAALRPFLRAQQARVNAYREQLRPTKNPEVQLR